MTSGNDVVEWVEEHYGELAQAFFESKQQDEIVESLINDKQDEFDRFCEEMYADDCGNHADPDPADREEEE